MAYIHIALSQVSTADEVRHVEEKVGARAAIDGLIVEAWGVDGDRLRHVTVWESQAHADRYAAEQLLPAFQALGMASKVAADTEFITCDTEGLFIRTLRGGSAMPNLALALPCLPGGADKLRRLVDECRGPRRAEFSDFHERVGLDVERWYLQQTPQGEVWVFCLEGDPAGAMAKLAVSVHPFDVWFREQVKEIHGVDVSRPLPGPPTEMIFEG